MATKITMPQLGESVTEGTISKWLVQVGDRVNKYDPLCEVMTDKVNAEVPAALAGIITDLVAKEDETIEVGELICYIQEENEAALENAENSVQEQAETTPQGDSSPEEKDSSMRKRYSPAVLKLASEHNIDLEIVKGTGLGGRITRKDLLSIIEQGIDSVSRAVSIQDPTPALEKVAPLIKDPIQPKETSPTSRGDDLEIPVSGIRRAIANKMLQSKHEAPHAWTMVEVDVTQLVAYRSRIKDEFKQKEGLNLTFLPFFIKAIIDSIKEYPILNSTWAGDKIIQKKEINISIAVATEDALFVPVIKRADEKSILGLVRAIYELAIKTRTGKLSAEDIQGGTFTVNNTGSFGSIQSAPIIDFPQAAIISIESIVKKPVVIDGMIGIRDMVNLCLSLDHRILDGFVCGRFLQSVKKRLESFDAGTCSLM